MTKTGEDGRSLFSTSEFVINSSFVILISSLLQSRYAKPAGNPAHLRLRKRFALFYGLLDRAQDKFL